MDREKAGPSTSLRSAPTAGRGRQDDDFVGVLTKSTLNKLALMGCSPGWLLRIANCRFRG